MKHALNSAGQLIEASADSDASGRCPHCDAPVILRRRRDGRGGVTYFWRHQDTTKLSCPTQASMTAVSGERGVQVQERSGT